MPQKEKSFSTLTLLAIEAALAAGDHLREGFGTCFSIDRKEGIHNLVTEYDHRAEKCILQFLQENGPPSQFLAEESGRSGTHDSLLWIIDPLDGTVNFAHGIPIFAVSIALQQNGIVELGVVYQPLTQELFVAEKGKGAFLDGKRIGVSPVPSIKDSILATGFPYNLNENPFHCIEHFVDMLKAGVPIRRLGAATIDFAYTAAGRFEGFFEASLAPWDCAAGKLLVEEAGGRVSSWEGKPFDIHSRRPVLATNNHIHAEAVKQLSKAL